MKKLSRHTLIVGLNDKGTKKQIYSSSYAKIVIMNIVGDCTISDTIGHYTHEDGSSVKENSIKVEMLFKNDFQVIDYAEKIKKALNQESVALVKDYVEGTLI